MRLDTRYRDLTANSVYTLDSRLNFLQELKKGSPLLAETRLLGYDEKRMQVFHELFHESEHFLAATYEVMMLHVDLEALWSAPVPAEILNHFERVYSSHKKLPRPLQVGRSVKQL